VQRWLDRFTGVPVAVLDATCGSWSPRPNPAPRTPAAFAISRMAFGVDDRVRNSAIGSLILCVVLLVVLFTPKANAFFTSRRV
jgi:hypothetical protein